MIQMMQIFHISINRDLNRRGSREGHKLLHLSNEPAIYCLCAQPPNSMISFGRKQLPNAVIGARYPNAVIRLVRVTYPKVAI